MTIPIEAGNRIQLPAEWIEALGLNGAVSLEKTADGILVRPARPARLADPARPLAWGDARLLELGSRRGVKTIVTEDQPFATVCARQGIAAASPLDATLRQQVAAWESANLPPKGAVRMLRRVHQWLNQAHPQAAAD